MTEKRNQKSASQWMFLPVLILLILWIAPVFAGETGGGDSPQAVFKAAQKAGANKDFAALAILIAPSELPMWAFGTDMGVGMFVEFYEGEKAAALKKEYQKIQNKYGIKTENEDESEKLHVTEDTPQEVIDAHIRKRAQKLYGDVDVGNYVPELMGIIVNMPEMAEQSFFPQDKLSDLKIDGERATAKAGEKDIIFLREGGRWYLTADVTN